MPVSVSIKYWGEPSRCYTFGHRTGNNSTWDEAAEALREAYQTEDGILCQNAKFDVDVAQRWFGLEVPAWDKIHDTMYLLFLDDPHQKELGLKPAAERLLGIPPDEQDAVADWLIEHQPIPRAKISKSLSSKHYFGKYIAFAPGNIVAEYADGDVDRTEAIFELLYDSIVERQMLEAYDRERRLMPILLETEQRGLPIDIDKLREDVATYNMWRGKIENWVIKTLGNPSELNLDSGAQLFDAMLCAGFIDIDKAELTPTGKYATNKNALLKAVNNKQLLNVLQYRAQLKTCLGTFMQPWLATAERSLEEKGEAVIYTLWNQVRAPRGGANAGTRTGRLSSTPNFQNIPKQFQPLFKHHSGANNDLPRSPFRKLPTLPVVRGYVVPFEGEVLIDRDFSQQELRILAHFDGGDMLTEYQQNPWVDFHDHTKAKLAEMGKIYERKQVKNTNFGLIYGMGVGTLAEFNKSTVNEAKALKKAILTLYPGLSEMYRDMKVRMKTNTPIRTWGGREYYCEPPKQYNGRVMTFDYKMVNVLVQGSAADCTKEAIIRFYDRKQPHWNILINVHDQITVSVPLDDMHEAMECLREAMESVEFDVKILSEGSVSYTNWTALKDYDKRGERC